MINFRFPVFRNGVTQVGIYGFSLIVRSNYVNFSS